MSFHYYKHTASLQNRNVSTQHVLHIYKIQIHHVRKYHSTRQNEIFISNWEIAVNCISTVRYTCNTIAVISCTKDVHSCPINFVQESFRNLHESTWWWTMYGKTVFSEEFELKDVTPNSDNACHPS
jgi:hypothetical protein